MSWKRNRVFLRSKRTLLVQIRKSEPARCAAVDVTKDKAVCANPSWFAVYVRFVKNRQNQEIPTGLEPAFTWRWSDNRPFN